MTYASRLAAIAAATRQGDVQIGPHTQDEMRQEGFSAADVIEALTSPEAEVIEDYPDDPRGASCLLFGRARGRSVHLVVTSPPRPLFVITVYDPALQPERWSQDFRRRRR
jgi:Domain of unknown function (DUF4258)